MSRILRKYLDHVIVYANRNEEESDAIRKEMEDHLLKKISDLESESQSHEDAVFEAIEQHGNPRTVGYGLRKHRWLDVRTSGTARGFIAIGPKAVGTIAIGGAACGVFACGIVSIGIFSLSVIGAGLLWCFGSLFAFAPIGLAHGQFAIGLMAVGIWSCGVVVIGGSDAWGLHNVDLYEGGVYGVLRFEPYFMFWLGAFIRTYASFLITVRTSIAMFSLCLGGLMSAGLAAIWRRNKIEKERIGYTVWRF